MLVDYFKHVAEKLVHIFRIAGDSAAFSAGRTASTHTSAGVLALRSLTGVPGDGGGDSARVAPSAMLRTATSGFRG